MTAVSDGVGADWGLARGWDLVPMDESILPLIVEIEQRSYSHPWGIGHFQDSLRGACWMPVLVTAPRPDDPAAWSRAPRLPDGRWVLGYLVAMKGFEEVHLLNITTAPEHRRQGCARVLMGALVAWTRLQQAQTLWLEVRASNASALALYADLGFKRVGLRKGYYPDTGAQREDAIVMNLPLDGETAGGQDTEDSA